MPPKGKEKTKSPAANQSQPPPSIEDLFTNLNRHIVGSEFELAVKVADQVLAVAPGDEDALRCKVVALVKAGDFDRALRVIQASQKSLVDFGFLKAYCLYRQNKLAEALESLKSDGEDYAAMLLEAQILYRMGKMDACLDIYKKLQNSKIESLEINYVAGLVSAGRASEVQGTLDAMRVKPTISFDLAYNMACSLIIQNKYVDAEQLLLSARRIGQETLMDEDLADDEIENELSPIAVQLAYVWQLLGQSEEAIGAYTDIINKTLADETSIAVAVNNLVSLKGSKDVSHGLRRLDKLFEKGDGVQGFQFTGTLATKLSAKQKEAIYTNRVLLLLHANKLDQARELVAALPNIVTDSLVPVLLQAAVFVRENRAGKAEEILLQQANKNPDKSKILFLARAQVAAAAGHHQIAAESLSLVPDIQNMPATVATLVTLKERAGDIDGANDVLNSAIQWWSNAMTENSKLDVILQQAASFKLKHGKQEEASHLFEELVKSHGSVDAMVGLVTTAAHLNVDKAETYSKKLKPLPGLKSVDLDSLEKTSGAKHVDIKIPETVDESKTKDKTKKKRKRKPKYPKGYDPANPGPPPDPERWLPKRERSTYRPKRKDKRAAQVRGSQGAFSRDKQEQVSTSNNSNQAPVRYRALVNGELTKTIIPERGIRQGDPISPYIFLICADWLSSALTHLMESNVTHGIQISRRSPSISHLFFADDSLIFFRANVAEAVAIRDVLRKYEAISGLGINRAKSEFVCSPNVCNEDWQSIEEVLGIKRVEKHTKYLGLPIALGRNKRDHFRELEDKIIKKTTDWKSKFLSRAGKEVLIKSILQSLPVYTMQVYKIPKTVCERMSKLMISFFWNKPNQDRSMHWINKDVLCTDKVNGGLGFRKLDLLNDAMLLKQAWRLIAQPDSLVSTLIKSKYYPSSSLNEALRRHNGSHFWNSIVKVKDFLQEGLNWSMSNDEPRWLLNSSGTYSVKSGYDMIKESNIRIGGREGSSSNQIPMRRFWKRIWNAKIPPRVRIHAWRAYYDSLPDGANLLKRCGLPVQACGWCGWKTDSILHITRDCWAGKYLGELLHIDIDVYTLGEGNMADWLFISSSILNPQAFRKLLCGCWVLWTSRNDFVHNDRLWKVEDMASKVKYTLAHFDSGTSITTSWNLALASSTPSPISVFCDGSWKWMESLGHGTAGWSVVIWAENSIVALNAGDLPPMPNPTSVEGYAILKGLRMGVRLRIKAASFFSDSIEAIRILALGAGFATQPPWLNPCLLILKEHPNWKIEWISREQNKIADHFSRKARRGGWSWIRDDAIPFCSSVSYNVE